MNFKGGTALITAPTNTIRIVVVMMMVQVVMQVVVVVFNICQRWSQVCSASCSDHNHCVVGAQIAANAYISTTDLVDASIDIAIVEVTRAVSIAIAREREAIVVIVIDQNVTGGAPVSEMVHVAWIAYVPDKIRWVRG